MMMFRAALLTGFALAIGSAVAQEAKPSAAPMQTLQMPATPNPARVTLDPRTTAVIVLDFVEDICNAQPTCTGKMLPAMVPFLAQARKAGLIVAYGTRERNMTKWLKEVAPAADDIKIMSMAQDRFFKTDLDKILKARGIKARHRGMEDQRFGDLHIGGLDGPRLHSRHSDGCDLGRQRL